MTSNVARTLAAIWLVLSACACAGRERPPPFMVTDSAGVEIVWSAAPERRAVEPVLRLAEQPALQLGSVPGAPDHDLYRVTHATRLADGSIAVANAGLAELRVYDASGALSRRLAMPRGHSGALAPLRVAQLRPDSLLVVLDDLSLAIFDGAGALARRTGSLAGNIPSDPPAIPAGILADGTVALTVFPPPDEGAPASSRTWAELLRFGTDAAMLGSLGFFERLGVLPGHEVLVFGPAGRQAVGRSTVWHTDGSTWELREVDPSGSLRRIARLDRQPEAVTGTDTLAFRQAALRQLEAMGGEEAARREVSAYRYPANFPAISELVVDSEGRVWAKSYRWFDIGAPARWSVFGAGGRFIGDVTMPSRLEVYEIGTGYVLGRITNGRGAEAVYLYELSEAAPE